MREKRKSLSAQVRREVWYGTYCSCGYCGKELEYEYVHIDHKESLARGGKDERLNYISACADCNSSKGTLSIEEYREKVREGVKALKESMLYKQCINYKQINELEEERIEDIKFYYEELDKDEMLLSNRVRFKL